MIADALMLSALLAGWVILLHRDGYQNYLSSFGWKLTKFFCKERECQQCGARTRLQLHHLSYDWHNQHTVIRWFIPNLFDPMITLCDYHHGKAHGKKG